MQKKQVNFFLDKVDWIDYLQNQLGYTSDKIELVSLIETIEKRRSKLFKLLCEHVGTSLYSILLHIHILKHKQCVTGEYTSGNITDVLDKQRYPLRDIFWYYVGNLYTTKVPQSKKYLVLKNIPSDLIKKIISKIGNNNKVSPIFKDELTYRGEFYE